VTALLAWLVFPVLATLVATGLGLLVDRAVGVALPGPLVPATGLALLIGLTQLTTWSPSIAPATPVIVVVLAVAGLVVGRDRLHRRRLDAWALAGAVGVFVVYLLPILLSGQVGFAGYVLLGDTSIHLGLADRVIHHGATTTGLTPSTYSVSLKSYFDNSYPTGSHTALGALGDLVPVDLAWLYQPFLSWTMALAALAFYELLRPLVAARPVRAFAAFVAAQPGLLYAFAMQGAIKELATVATLVTFFALIPWLLRPPLRWRKAVALAVAAAGSLGAIDLAAAAWLGPGLLAAALVLAWRLGRARIRETAAHVAAFAVVGAVFVGPTLASSGSFVQNTEHVLTSGVELGDLQGPLDSLEVFGVWPRGDFRLSADKPGFYLLIGCVVVALGLGLLHLLRGRGWAVLTLVGASLIAFFYITRTGSPWVDAKALAILAPVVMLVAVIGAISLGGVGRRIEAGVLLAAIGAGVLWTNAVAYHDVQLSNYPRLHELEQLGKRYAGQGPTFTPEFEEFAKYFLRDMAPTAGSEPYKPGPSGMIPGGGLRFGFSVEVGQFNAGYVDSFRTIVLRRSPEQSRPPATFSLVHRGRFYAVWQRGPHAAARQVLGELSLGTRYQPGAVPACGAVRALAAGARRAHAQLASVPAANLVVAAPDGSRHSLNWGADGADPTTFRSAGPGWLRMVVHAPVAGRYTAWTEASLPRSLNLSINGQRVATIPSGLSPRGPGEDVRVGTFALPAGRSVIRIERPGGNLDPGNGSASTLLGPTSFVLDGSDARPVRTTAPRDWRTLCGHELDWVEIVR
jgi:hypothetical protein